MKTGEKKPSLVLVSLVYLAGIFMGAIDTGIVTPARTLIQTSLGVDAQTGIWMITIYTLAYAASIPIMGKLADRYGRKYVYLGCILLFGTGSLFCGLSENFGGFGLLLGARVVQAIGGGGILPVATAEFGTSFPPEKRGMALGLVGGVYGVANIFGASAGSLILDLFGADRWQFIFYINLPITVFILAAGFFTLQNTSGKTAGKTDIGGIFTLTAMTLSLLYGLKNLDFFDLSTIANKNVYPFLILFLVLLPVFILLEKKAADPVMNLKYFTDRNIAITLLISFVSGIVMMGMIFVPQFSENALKIPTGSGGYLVIILGVFAGVGAPISGKLIDKFGVKLILGGGFAFSIAGALFLIFVATARPGFVTVMISLMLIGIGIGFTMGTPLNYMMLENTEERESNSALAALSLIRSVGTAIAPAIMVGFIAHAGGMVQGNVMALLPQELQMPPLPYAQEITDEVNALKASGQMGDQLAAVEIPDLTAMQHVSLHFDADSGYEMPPALLSLMQNSDVTTITANTKTLSASMFDEMSPRILSQIDGGLSQGIDGIAAGEAQMQETITQMEAGLSGISQGISGMESALTAQNTALSQLRQLSDQLSKMGNPTVPQGMTMADLIPAPAKAAMPAAALEQLSQLHSAEELNAKIAGLQAAVDSLSAKLAQSRQQQADMTAGLEGIRGAVAQMEDLSAKMTALENALPEAFAAAEADYLSQIDDLGPALESAFQTTLNTGFRNVYLTSAIAACAAEVFLLFYRGRKKEAALAGK